MTISSWAVCFSAPFDAAAYVAQAAMSERVWPATASQRHSVVCRIEHRRRALTCGRPPGLRMCLVGAFALNKMSRYDNRGHGRPRSHERGLRVRQRSEITRNALYMYSHAVSSQFPANHQARLLRSTWAHLPFTCTRWRPDPHEVVCLAFHRVCKLCASSALAARAAVQLHAGSVFASHADVSTGQSVRCSSDIAPAAPAL